MASDSNSSSGGAALPLRLAIYRALARVAQAREGMLAPGQQQHSVSGNLYTPVRQLRTGR